MYGWIGMFVIHECEGGKSGGFWVVSKFGDGEWVFGLGCGIGDPLGMFSFSFSHSTFLLHSASGSFLPLVRDN